MNNILMKIKKNKLLTLVSLTYLILFLVNTDKAILSVKNSMYYVKEMLEIMPAIFVITALIEKNVPKKVILNNLGENSGFKGIILSFILGSFSAGPIYAAFPICRTLIKKGASVSNIVIILSSWAVIKVPMLLNEAKFLGIKFMFLRWILTIISILCMSYLVSLFVKRSNVPNIEKKIIELN
ncbi:permease [Caloranaerobacter azorensis]|uniref:Predicted permease n=1 Tax=Caloranaerobacter azorensis DSM 13643 TaxID=1121264 RepID=A0A1M5TPQ8_9FIRM|nr:permease [Caloranaerobacter azorensis]SHH52805.1 Predicted permease [Caloranaerobacter azorensis DSM 13643]